MNNGWRLFGQFNIWHKSNVGVLLIHPFGEEKKKWQRTFTVLSRCLSEDRMTHLTFDLSGCGESEGSNVKINTWLDDIEFCAKEMLHKVDIQHLILIGVRLGASLSLLCSQRLPKAYHIWVDPIFAIRNYFKNLNRRQSVHNLLNGNSNIKNLSYLDIEGCKLSSDFLKEIEEYQLQIDALLYQSNIYGELIHSGKYRSYYFDKAKRKRSGLTTKLSLDWGKDAVHKSFSNIILLRIKNRIEKNSKHSPYNATNLNCDIMRFLSPTTEYGTNIQIENPRGNLHSMLNLPSGSSSTVICLHGRAGYRIGPNNLFCEISKMLNNKGISCLRIDYAGWGNSDGEGFNSDTDLTDKDIDLLVEDLKSAVRFTKDRIHARKIIVLGMCLGGYVALKYLHNNDIDGLILLSPYIMGIENISKARFLAGSAIGNHYAKKIVSINTWKRLIRTEIDFGEVIQVIKKTVFPEKIKGALFTSSTGTLRNKMPCLQIYGQKDPYADITRKIMERQYRYIFDIYNGEIIINSDHNFGSPYARKQLLQAIESWIQSMITSQYVC